MNQEKMIEMLDEKRAKLLETICEDITFYNPHLINNTVIEIRTITKILKEFKNGGEENN